MKLLIAFFLISFTAAGQTSIRYSGKVEVGYLSNQNLVLRINPGENWKGYNLEGNQNGVEISLINGIVIRDRFFVGIGTGYLNFEGVNGASLTGDLAYQPLQKRVSPTLNFRAGYSHIWNQYEGGTGTPLIEPGIGVVYRTQNKKMLLLRTSLLVTQQVAFFALRLGYGLK